MKKSLITLSAIGTGLASVYAQATSNLSPLFSLLGGAQVLVSRLVPFLIGLAVVVFFWYLIMFIVKGNNDPEGKQMSLKGMGYSILAIFVMVSIWGIIAFVSSLTGITPVSAPPVVNVLPPQQ